MKKEADISSDVPSDRVSLSIHQQFLIVEEGYSAVASFVAREKIQHVLVLQAKWVLT